MTIGDALYNIFWIVLGLGLVAIGVILLVKLGRAVLTLALVIFGLAVVLAMYQDAIHGWPILSRVAWLFYQVIQNIYNGADQATSGVPQLKP